MNLSEMIAAERRAMADVIAGLSEDQLRTPSAVPFDQLEQ